MSDLNLYDREKPEAKYVCDGCWATSNEEKLPVGWLYVSFKYLKDTWLWPGLPTVEGAACGGSASEGAMRVPRRKPKARPHRAPMNLTYQEAQDLLSAISFTTREYQFMSGHAAPKFLRALTRLSARLWAHSGRVKS